MSIRKIDVVPIEVKWNDKGTKLALICQDVTYILIVNIQSIHKFIEAHTETSPSEEECCEDAFNIEHTIEEKVISSTWIDDIFVFINTRNKINYLINTQIFQISALSSQ